MEQSRQLWYVLSRVVNTLERGLLECNRTSGITAIRPNLKERVDGPEDEVPSRIGVVRGPLSWHQAWSGVLLEGLLVRSRRSPNRNGCEDDHETCPPTHTAPNKILRVENKAQCEPLGCEITMLARFPGPHELLLFFNEHRADSFKRKTNENPRFGV